jgi:hypothetical protein
MKLNISRIFETSQLLATEAGDQLKEMITYMADLSEQVLRALRNQLNYGDNFDAIVSNVSLTHQVTSTINTDRRTPVGIEIQRVVSTQYGIDGHGWYVDEDESVKLWVSFVDNAGGTPTEPQSVRIVIFFS